MKILVLRSIPLSEQTRDAFKQPIDNLDVRFVKRGNEHRVIELANKYGYDFVWNHGHMELPDTIWDQGTVPVFNRPRNVKMLLTPASTRHSVFGSLLPPKPEVGDDCWVKGYGRAGRNKERTICEYWPDGNGWDIQKHVEGQEYRVITVGKKVVQVFERHGDNDFREYQWVGLKGTPMVVKDFARHCAGLLEGENIISWDLIMADDGSVFLFEGNTAGALNEASARRVFDQIATDYNNYTASPYEAIRGEIITQLFDERRLQGTITNVTA